MSKQSMWNLGIGLLLVVATFTPIFYLLVWVSCPFWSFGGECW